MPENQSSIDPFDKNKIQCGYDPQTESQNDESLGKGNQENLLGSRTWGDIYSFCSKLEVLQQNPEPEHHQTLSFISNYNVSDNLQFGKGFRSTQQLSVTKRQEHVKRGTSLFVDILQRDKSSSHIDYLDLLRNYGSGFTKSNGGKDHNLSTEEVMRIAGKMYIHRTGQSIDKTIALMHMHGSSLSGLSMEERQKVELVELLLTAAEKVGHHQHEQANRLLTRCNWLASDSGNPVQRVVYYFMKSLRERIHRETGRIITNRTKEKQKHNFPPVAMSTNLVFLKFHQEFPFNQVMTFAGLEAILERVEKNTKIHLIDFQIRSGVQWTAFIQALSERVSNPIKHLKITAIGTTDRQKMEETGKSLESFAKSLNLPFSYRIVFLSDMNDLQKEHFIIKPREALIVYCPVILRTMVCRPYCLENLMTVIKKLNPSMVVVIEVEANLNSPSFFHRFVEALFYYSAYFDCLEDCTDRDNHYRNILEQVFLGDGIYNIIAAEGKDRMSRSVKMSVWETFFQRFTMVQMELGESSISHANLNLKRFSCASSCNLDYNGKTLTVGWKGTPFLSLSTWKFY